MTESRQVILCDEMGRATGTADIIAAHSGKGMLHLAFSVYVFSPDCRSLLLQQRSAEKRLWPLAWANTCCSHPRDGESATDAGRRRLVEELGLKCDLQPGPAFVYRAEDPTGRGVEHEYDMLLIGMTSAEPVPDPAEVNAWKWISLEDLRRELIDQPADFAPWLHQGLPLLCDYLASRDRTSRS
jgi:isopentenyl-diphosphate delta-isomerase